MKSRELLEQPFDSAQIRQRKGNFGSTLDYVEGHTVIQRLNDALDGNWSFEITTQDILEKSDEVVVIGRLQAGGVTKMQFGSSAITRNKDTGDMVSLADDFKAAATDSLKKCATLLGVGLHLYQSKRSERSNTHRGDNVTPLYPEAGGASCSRQLPSRQTSRQRLTERQFNYILRLGMDRGIPRQELDQYCIQAFGVIPSELSRSDASQLIEVLRSRQDNASPDANDDDLRRTHLHS